MKNKYLYAIINYSKYLDDMLCDEKAYLCDVHHGYSLPTAEKGGLKLI